MSKENHNKSIDDLFSEVSDMVAKSYANGRCKIMEIRKREIIREYAKVAIASMINDPRNIGYMKLCTWAFDIAERMYAEEERRFGKK